MAPSSRSRRPPLPGDRLMKFTRVKYPSDPKRYLFMCVLDEETYLPSLFVRESRTYLINRLQPACSPSRNCRFSPSSGRNSDTTRQKGE